MACISQLLPMKMFSDGLEYITVLPVAGLNEQDEMYHRATAE